MYPEHRTTINSSQLVSLSIESQTSNISFTLKKAESFGHLPVTTGFYSGRVLTNATNTIAEAKIVSTGLFLDLSLRDRELKSPRVYLCRVQGHPSARTTLNRQYIMSPRRSLSPQLIARSPLSLEKQSPFRQQPSRRPFPPSALSQLLKL